jgi:glycosyltransferase involved in cell wall biosynthesis
MSEQGQAHQAETTTATAVPTLNKKKVVVCTPTYNRRFCLDFSVECFRRQTYPNLHWIIVDNSSDDEKSWKDIQQKEGLSITYIRIPEKKTIGRLRNIMMQEALKHDPDYLAFWDDDDYYVPGRIQISVDALEKNPKYDIVGCEVMSVFLTRENVLMDVGPYGRNHATAATYVFRAECARTRYFLETASKAEESTFTRDWTLEMIMLPAKQIMLVLGHSQNTVNKSEIFVDPKKFGSRMNNADNAKNIVRFQWIQDPSMWAVFRKTFLDV